MSLSYLVATDMSARSDRALRRAVQLADATGASLSVLHVVDDATPDTIAVELKAACEGDLRRMLEGAPEAVRTTVKVVIGDPTATVIDLVREMGPDLLIMGTHRDRRFLDSIRETTAQRIVRLTDCPVLVAVDPTEAPYDHILGATDFSPAAAAAIKLAHELAPAARLTPVHSIHVPYQGILTQAGGTDDIEASFRKAARESDARWRGEYPLPAAAAPTVIRTGSTLDVLSNEAARGATTLISAGAHGQVGQHRALLGSVATSLMRVPPCDVLIARP